MKKNKLDKGLSFIFWVNIILVTSIFLLVLWLKGPDFGKITTNIAFERWAIIITLASIPIGLKVFHSQMIKYREQNKSKLTKRYKQLYLGRLLLFELVVAMNIIGFQIYESSNFIYMTIIMIFAMVFCYPNKNIYFVDEPENEN